MTLLFSFHPIISNIIKLLVTNHDRNIMITNDKENICL